jgi:hypothetical protein
MNRHLLKATMALGVILTLVGATGIFAVFSDRATTGNNDVSSGELAHAADLAIATAQIVDIGNDGIMDVACEGVWHEDLVTGIFSAGDLQPSVGDEYAAHLCLYNAGSAALELTMSAIDLTDADIACTGDEAASGDATCGEVAGVPQLGELSPLIKVDVLGLECNGATGGAAESGWSSLAALSQNPTPIFATPVAGALLRPGEIGCISLRLRYPNSASAAEVQLAQSDRVTWRFAFDGTAS